MFKKYHKKAKKIFQRFYINVKNRKKVKISSCSKYNMSKNRSFGSKLLTEPGQFFLKSDTIDDKNKIVKFFDIIKNYISSPEIDNLSHSDKIKLVRIKSKKGFCFNIQYYSSENKVPMNILMNNSDGLTRGTLIVTLQQITQPILTRQGMYKSDKSLLMNFPEIFSKTFGLNFTEFLVKILRNK